MPKIKSAIKRVDVAERNRERNRSWRSAIRSARSKAEDAAVGDDAAAATATLNRAYSLIDRAVTKGILHKNTAARRKSRLVKMGLKAKTS